MKSLNDSSKNSSPVTPSEHGEPDLTFSAHVDDDDEDYDPPSKGEERGGIEPDGGWSRGKD
jgi:hypothetical protein